MVLFTQSLTPLSPPCLCITLQVFDAFSPRLTDRNSKVNLHALEAFSNIVPLLGNMLVPIVNNVVTALVPNLASRNPTIHSTAMTVLDLLSQCIGKEDTTEVLTGREPSFGPRPPPSLDCLKYTLGKSWQQGFLLEANLTTRGTF